MSARIRAAYVGEDVPITVLYEDPDTGNAVDPDDTTVDPTITITAPDDTDVISDVVMDALATGEFEYVWDTSTDASGAGEYTVNVSADFDTETTIERSTVRLR